jgi:hypothetical protein
VQDQFIIPSFEKIFSTWKLHIDNNLTDFRKYSEISLYIYLIVTFIGFGIFWMMYLNKLNTQLNQTIQMLNMIPISMLPKERKDIREFLSNIIREANKKKN